MNNKRMARQRLAASLNIIEHLMDDVGLTLADIAEELNLSEKTISRWWNQKSCPSLNHFIELLGISTPEEKED